MVSLLLGACGVPRAGLHGDSQGSDAAIDASIDAAMDASVDAGDLRDSCVGPAGPMEICNGRDDDCDSLVDEDPSDGTLWYRDADEDGFGDEADAIRSCGPAAGRVDNPDDCDDTTRDVSPDAAETCNSRDDDCDGLVDEGAGPLWYEDADGDGFGNPGSSMRACAPPIGFVADGSDCDDGCALCYPGYPSDICGDGRDNDCDGTADGGACECLFADTPSGPYIVCEDRTLTWDEARAYCVDHGGDLASLDSSAEQDEVWALLDPINQHFWIGGHDPSNDGNWVWVDGDGIARCDGPDSSTCSCADFCNFRSDRPDGDDEDCLWLDKNQGGRWDDKACDENHRFICEL